MDNTILQQINHRFEKGNELSLTVGASKTALDNGNYQLMIVVNQESSTDYGISYLNASLSSSSETQFLNALAGKGGGEYDVPDISYDGNTKIQRFDGINYLYYSAIVTDGDPASEMELTLRYRIKGKNRYFLNKFMEITTLPIRFSESAEPDPPHETEETNPVTNEDEEETVAISDTSIKTIAETLADDYFVADHGIGVYYANVSDKPSWQDYTFTKGEFFGEILSYTEELALSKIKPWSANVLPVGTKLYRANEELSVVLAEIDGMLIPYLKIVEG